MVERFVSPVGRCRQLHENDLIESWQVTKVPVMNSVLKTLVATAIAIFAAISATLAQVPEGFRNSQIVILEHEKGDHGYWFSTSLANPPKLLPLQRVTVRDTMLKRHVLEQYAAFLSPLRLPRQLRLLASDCGGNQWDSPYYLSQLQWIDMCYSFIGWAENNIDDLIKNYSHEKWWTPSTRKQLVAGMFVGVLLHETGHALFDLLNVPVFGREEDAADQMAAFIPLQFDKKTARTAIKGFVYLWQYLATVRHADPPATGQPSGHCPDPGCRYSDEHGTPSQRMYNVVCIAYGGDPANFRDLVDAGLLPPERAKNCHNEYEQVRTAFKKTVLPFIDPVQMKKVRSRQWFQTEELQEK
jgi:Putative metallopeptidase